jgi:phage tail-like protein
MPELELPSVAITSVTSPVLDAPLVVINRSPEPDEAGVPLTSTLELTIASLRADALEPSSVDVSVDDVPAVVAGVIATAFVGPVALVESAPSGLRVVLAPTVPLTSDALVAVRLRARTRGGALLDESWTFRAEDRTAPRVLAAVAVSPSVVRLAFDEPVLVPESATFEITAEDAPAVTPRVIAAAADGLLVDVTLTPVMSESRRYTIRVRGVTDVAGNGAAPPYDTAVFIGWGPARPARRRFDLWSFLPKSNRRRDAGALAAFIASLQEIVDMLLATIDRMPDRWDIERASAADLDAILRDLGNPFGIELDVVEQRRLAASLVGMYRLKGTARGIREAIAFFLGLDAQIVAFTSTALVLGESELDYDWELGPSDRFSRYAFDVEVARALTDHERQVVREIVEWSKPAHTHFVELVEPEPVVEPDHWELDESDLDETTLLH